MNFQVCELVALDLNPCEPRRTKLFKFYPKGYPQKLGIV